MFSWVRHSLVSTCLIAVSVLPARGQEPLPPQAAEGATASVDTPFGDFTSSQWRLERLSDNHWRMTGQVEIERDGLKFFADEVELFGDSNRLVASGNVVFAHADGRISAERVEFDTEKLVGSFTQASGFLSLGPNADRTQFAGQDPDVYFYGDLLEKTSEKEYRLTGGAFTTCVQPTPRWEFTSGSVVIKLDDRAVLHNMVFRVKGVPLFYLPYAYYPLKKEQRSTGFLLPSYGSSTFRGQSISNAFFWAMGRSQDATFFHDWFGQTGQGEGVEYRYVAAAGSEGNFRTYLFNQKAAEFTTGGVTSLLPANRSFEFAGNASQALPLGLRARARFDYFSDLTTQQLYHGNIYDASRRLRTLGGSVNGNWGPYSLSSVFQHNEAFEGDDASIVYGATPRITATLSQQRLFGMPIYGGMVGEYANLLFRDQRGATAVDSSLKRVDVHPSLRIPFSNLSFLTVNSSAAYRLTHYSDSLDPRTGMQSGIPLTRSYFSLRSEVIGPVFTRIFDTPQSGIAERFKHVIEPTFGFEQTSGIDNYEQVVILTDYSDLIVGGLTRLTYGLTNRLIARERGTGGAQGQAREFLTASIQQTYYGTPAAAQYDIAYASSTQGNVSRVSPVALTVRAAPSRNTNATVRLEQSLTGGGLQSLSISSNARVGTHSVDGSWSRRQLSPLSPVESYLNSRAALSFKEGQMGGNYAISWDIGRGTVVSQTAQLFYNAQCCGLGFEYQAFSYPQISARFPIPADRRVNFTFMLAGLSNFSNFFGSQR
jgi:LPS-assembly protein